MKNIIPHAKTNTSDSLSNTIKNNDMQTKVNKVISFIIYLLDFKHSCSTFNKASFSITLVKGTSGLILFDLHR